MTPSLYPHTQAALRRSVVQAIRAPSVHNTQPWRFVLRPGALEIHADWTRQLPVLDPRGRQLLMSCGCAVFNARAALAAAGVHTVVQPMKAVAAGLPVATLAVRDGPLTSDEIAIGRLDSAIEARQTNRRRFTEEHVPVDLVDILVQSARSEGCRLFPVEREAHRVAVAYLSQLADRIENADPAYRAELRQWTTDDPDRVDAVPSFAIPHVDGLVVDDVPIRDFDTHGTGALPADTHSSAWQCLLLLGTDADNPATWLRAGEALERVLLDITRAGYIASPITQIIEVPRTHEMLCLALDLGMNPHVLLRVGTAPATPITRRRHLVDVLTEMP
jgi:hypothetical protein